MNFVYIVVCCDDAAEIYPYPEKIGGAVMPTRQAWYDEDAALTYAASIAPSRNPVVVQVHHPSQWRFVRIQKTA